MLNEATLLTAERDVLRPQLKKIRHVAWRSFSLLCAVGMIRAQGGHLAKPLARYLAGILANEKSYALGSFHSCCLGIGCSKVTVYSTRSNADQYMPILAQCILLLQSVIFCNVITE